MDGGWTKVFNRFDERDDGEDEDKIKNEEEHNNNFFNKKKEEYVKGFGEFSKNYWLGLRPLRNIVKRAVRTEVRIAARNKLFKDKVDEAYYSSFDLGLTDSYKITLGELYAGNLHDVHKVQSGNEFSTYDDDLTTHECPHKNKAGWWFNEDNCYNGGMCLTCAKKQYYSGNGEHHHDESYHSYSFIQMWIKAIKNSK